MLPQRARVAESRAENRIANGSLRARSKEAVIRRLRVFRDVRHTSVAGSMLVLRREPDHDPVSGWHRGYCILFVPDRRDSVRDFFRVISECTQPGEAGATGHMLIPKPKVLSRGI